MKLMKWITGWRVSILVFQSIFIGLLLSSPWYIIAKVMGTSHIHKMTRGWIAVGIRCFSPILILRRKWHRTDMIWIYTWIFQVCKMHVPFPPENICSTKKANILQIWMIQVCYYMYVWLVYIIIYMPSFPYWLTNHSSRIRNKPNESNDRRWWGHSNRTMKSTWGWHEITKQEGSIVIMIIVYN